MDIVFIEKLRIPATIGAWEWEHRIKQNLIVDIEMECDFQQAAQSDSIEHAINYKDAASKVYDYVAESNFKLLETVAHKIAALLLEEFPITWCRVKVSKPQAVEKAANVGVIVERRTEPSAPI